MSRSAPPAIRPAILSALILAALPAAAQTRTDVDTGGRRTELRTCLTDLADLVPPGSTVADPDRFCACYADAAVKAGLPELERAEANLGQEVRPPQARATATIRTKRSNAIAKACLAP
jgi:hypothetical protein